MLKSYKIDSLKISIPFEKCTIPDGSNLLTEPVFVPVDLDSGNIDLTAKPMIKNFVYGLSTYQEMEINDRHPDRFLIPIKYAKGQIVSGRTMSKLDGKTRPVHVDSVLIQVSAKACKELYFHGITRETLPIVYDHIIKSGQVHFSFDDFLNGACNDIDICADYDSDVVIGNLRKVVKDSIRERFKELCKSYKKSGNQGLELGSRKMSGIDKPYLKVYHKRKQMENEYINTKGGMWKRNLEFAETYLQGGLESIPKNLIRFEFNIKNNEALSHFLTKTDNLFAQFDGVKLNTLRTLVSVTQEQWQIVSGLVWSKWLHVQSAYMTNTFPDVEYTGAKNGFEAMFIGMLMIHWQDRIPKSLGLAKAEALQLYQLALSFSEFKESERTTFRRRADIPTVATWVYNRLHSETNVRLLEQVRKIEMHTEALHLLFDMNFPLTDVDLIIGNQFENVGRLGLYDKLNEFDTP